MVYTFAGTPVNYWSAVGNGAGAAPYLYAQGSDSSVDGKITAKGVSGAIRFQSNGGTADQLVVSPTTSSVNYLQVTGNTAGGGPTISAQGSDTNIDLVLFPKANGNVRVIGSSTVSRIHSRTFDDNYSTLIETNYDTTQGLNIYNTNNLVLRHGSVTGLILNYVNGNTNFQYRGTSQLSINGANNQVTVLGPIVVQNTASALAYGNLGGALQVAGGVVGSGFSSSGIYYSSVFNAPSYTMNSGFQYGLMGSYSASTDKWALGSGATANWSGGNVALIWANTGVVTINTTTPSTSNTTGSLVVNGGLGLSGNLSMNLASSGTGVNRLTLSPQSYFNTFNATGDIAYNGPSGAAFLFNNSQVFIQNQLIQRGPILNDSGNNTVIFSGSSPVLIQNTATSISNTSGALIISGGLGVQGNVNLSLTQSQRLQVTTGNYFTSGGDGSSLMIAGGGYAYFNNSLGIYNQNALYQRGAISNDSGNNQVLIYPTSPLRIANTTPSTNTTTGALIVAGGVGISGALNATTKSFNIPHPTKEGKNLRYGSLEGPEFGVYVRGTLKGSNVIELPDYWTKLVDANTITVSLTSIGKYQKLSVKEVKDNTIIINSDGWFKKEINCYYVVYGERADVDKLDVEA
jgi:hypothetical protein